MKTKIELNAKETEAFPDMLLALQRVYYAAKKQRHKLSGCELQWGDIMPVKEALVKAGHAPPKLPPLPYKTKL